MYDSAMTTAFDGGVETRVLFLVDNDDDRMPEYVLNHLPIRLGSRLGYVGSLNRQALDLWDHDGIIGAFGDDVLFRTNGWDDRVRETLAKPGIAYADDLIHGANHPSAVFMSNTISRALGWLALPATTHQWADDGWKVLGQRLGILRFMPGVVIEHMHPAVGKAEDDETYRSVFDSDRAKADYEGFVDWRDNGGLDADAAKVSDVIG